MKQVSVSEHLRTKLHGLAGRIHLCDEDGYLLTVIEPVGDQGAASSLVTWDDELSQMLGNVGAGIEFLNEAGQVVARIPPSTEPGLPNPLTSKQLDDYKARRQAGEGGISTEELVRRLRSK